MGIKIIELKDYLENTHERVFCFEITAIGQFLDWEGAMLSEDKVKEYIKEHPFPDDKYYNGEIFLQDINSQGTIRIGVEKEKTAEYIAELFYDLI